MIFGAFYLSLLSFLWTEAATFSLLNQTALAAEEAEAITLRQFEDFIVKYEKNYEDEAEKMMRYATFKMNLKRAEYLQSQELGTAVYGITKFSDVTDEEFSKHYANLKHSGGFEAMRKYFGADSTEDSELEELDMLASNSSLEQGKDVDWRKNKPAPKVKDQGKCGSCWAFASSAMLEYLVAKKKKKVVMLSDQQLVDCVKPGCDGCNGGMFEPTLQYMQKVGIVSAADYPYTGKDGACRADTMKKKTHYKTTSFKILGKGENLIKANLAKSPIIVGVSAKAVQLYTRGIMNPSETACPKGFDTLDHAMLVVGCGEETVKKKKVKHFIVQNSWGTSFGEGGYVRFQQDVNACGIANEPHSGTH